MVYKLFSFGKRITFFFKQHINITYILQILRLYYNNKGIIKMRDYFTPRRG
jgi:hypothetical protein